jgi:hypothetical protein
MIFSFLNEIHQFDTKYILEAKRDLGPKVRLMAMVWRHFSSLIWRQGEVEHMSFEIRVSQSTPHISLIYKLWHKNYDS